MKVKIKLYGHLICQNENLNCLNENRFTLDVRQGITLSEIHRLIFANPADNIVSIIDGHAEKPAYVIEHECSISIFPPMGGRTHDPFAKL